MKLSRQVDEEWAVDRGDRRAAGICQKIGAAGPDANGLLVEVSSRSLKRLLTILGDEK